MSNKLSLREDEEDKAGRESQVSQQMVRLGRNIDELAKIFEEMVQRLEVIIRKDVPEKEKLDRELKESIKGNELLPSLVPFAQSLQNLNTSLEQIRSNFDSLLNRLEL